MVARIDISAFGLFTALAQLLDAQFSGLQAGLTGLQETHTLFIFGDQFIERDRAGLQRVDELLELELALATLDEVLAPVPDEVADAVDDGPDESVGVGEPVDVADDDIVAVEEEVSALEGVVLKDTVLVVDGEADVVLVVEGVALMDAVEVVDGLELRDEVGVVEGVSDSEAVDVVDGEHDAHTVLAEPVQAVSTEQGHASHTTHAVDPVPEAYAPVGHDVHPTVPVVRALYAPTAHCVHTLRAPPAAP